VDETVADLAPALVFLLNGAKHPPFLQVRQSVDISGRKAVIYEVKKELL